MATCGRAGREQEARRLQVHARGTPVGQLFLCVLHSYCRTGGCTYEALQHGGSAARARARAQATSAAHDHARGAQGDGPACARGPFTVSSARRQAAQRDPSTARAAQAERALVHGGGGRAHRRSVAVGAILRVGRKKGRRAAEARLTSPCTRGRVLAPGQPSSTGQPSYADKVPPQCPDCLSWFVCGRLCRLPCAPFQVALAAARLPEYYCMTLYTRNSTQK